MILAKISMDIPLPMPRSVICSPSHIKNIAPATNEVTAGIMKVKPELNVRPPATRPADIPTACTSAKASVPCLVYLFKMRRPDSPSFFKASSEGTTADIICTTIDAEI